MNLFAAKPVGRRNGLTVRALLVCAISALLFSACADIQKPRIQEYYGVSNEAPKKQEFRWSNGRLPKQLDPALAAAPPETDLVRAVYEGLTDLDAKTLEPHPAAAERWEVSEDGRTWTFHLRKSARWTNGAPVTAKDFARSWRRLAEMGTAVPHSSLLKNIVGAENFSIDDGISILPPEEFEVFAEERAPVNPNANSNTSAPADNIDNKDKTAANSASDSQAKQAPAPDALPADAAAAVKPAAPAPKNKPTVQKWFGVEAVNDQTLRIFLIQPDHDFLSVVAHPVFRPIYEDAANIDSLANAPKAITNGPFQVASTAREEIVLHRSTTYWDKDHVGLEAARMIAKPDAESALAAYRSNEVDAITNTHFEPLALKLLTPYQDFKRTTHNAVTFYQFNTANKPFNDVRVREALAMAMERDRLVQDEMDSAGEPALDFLPFKNERDEKVKEGIDGAKKLLAEAGFADTATFPKVRLLVNRNDLQRRIANSVKSMWWKNLGIDVEITILDRADYEAAITAGNYDLVRRGVVMPTANETVSMLSMFDEMNEDPPLTENTPAPSDTPLQPANGPLPKLEAKDIIVNPVRGGGEPAAGTGAEKTPEPKPAQKIVILTEQQAMERLPAIPLYFPISYSLVKPYVTGFDANMLDAPSLKTVVINDGWQAPASQK